MMTIDKLLLKIVNSSSLVLEKVIAVRDAKILRSLSISVSGQNFITENQSRLLVRILKENSKKMSEFTDEIDTAIEAGMWSRKFREIEQVRKISLQKDETGELAIFVEFTFSSEIRKIFGEITKKLEHQCIALRGDKYQVELTEKNIVLLLDTLKNYKFQIDEILQSHYDTIKSWSVDTVKDQFVITNILNQNFQKHITADLGLNTSIDDNIINDRSVRYQYFTEKPKKTEKSLISSIASRTQPRVWVSKKENTLSSILNALNMLRRAPVLVIFENASDEKTLKNLEIFDSAIKDSGLDKNVGVYFRLSNSDTGKKFNKLIADNSYNKKLDSSTEIVAVQSGKLPKFFLKNDWKPMSVIVIDSVMGMRHGKTAIYSNCCDLIVEYADEPNIKDFFTKW